MRAKHPDRSVIKRHKCNFCSYSSNCNADYQRHIRIHTKEKPFVCKICSKTFAQKGHLTTHMYTHTQERSYECSKCYKRFCRADVLKSHIRNVHDKYKPYACIVCGMTFGDTRRLNKHLLSHVGNYKCQRCKHQFENVESMRKHECVSK